MEVTMFAAEPRDPDDGDLARAHLAGDPDAFTTLIQRYYPRLLTTLQRQFRDSVLVEEVAQETVARVLKSLPTYEPGRPFWPWMKKIAFNLASTEAGRRATEVAVPEIEDRAEPREVDLVETFALRDVLERALRGIPARHRRALVMRYVEDREPEEIARAFGLKRSALEQLLFRARNNLAREYAVADGQSWMPGVAGLPLLVRLRELVASWHARAAASADAALAVASNVAIGLAIAAGGAGAAASTVGTVAAFDPSSPGVVVTAPAGELPLGGDARRAATAPVAADRTTARPAVTATPTSTTKPDGPGRYTPPPPGDDDDHKKTDIQTPKNGFLGGRVILVNNPLEEGEVASNDVEVKPADVKTHGETNREEGDGPTCTATNRLLFCD